MNAPSQTDDAERREADSLVKDYELKISYLTDHFSRIWTRFNFFVGIQTALIGGTILSHDGKMGKALPVVGAALGFIWYVMGAEDRYLVEIYRKHVAEAGKLFARSLQKYHGGSYRYVGEIEETSAGIPMRISGWRLDSISTTKLAALIPLLVTLAWIGLLISEHY